MILRGPKSNESNNPFFTQAVLTLIHLLMFNTIKWTREESASSFHSQTRETPIVVLCILEIREIIHTKARKIEKTVSTWTLY